MNRRTFLRLLGFGAVAAVVPKGEAVAVKPRSVVVHPEVYTFRNFSSGKLVKRSTKPIRVNFDEMVKAAYSDSPPALWGKK